MAIVGMDGGTRAKATFQPRVLPGIPDVAIPMKGPAQVVGSGVFYMDGVGQIRVLRPDNQPQPVATVTIQPTQEEPWFAVSPDGSRVIVGILTFPALRPPPPGSPFASLVGPWKFDLEVSAVGGSITVLQHQETSASPDSPGRQLKPVFPIGWTPAGPVAMLPSAIGTQQGWSGGALYVLDSAGKTTQQLGGSDCSGVSVNRAGFIPCLSSSGKVEVRDSYGDVIWTPHVDGIHVLSLYLSPDGQGISDGHLVETRLLGMITMAPEFLVQGWLDNNTVIGRTVPGGHELGDMAWISLEDPSVIHDLGFKGDFVGRLDL